MNGAAPGLARPAVLVAVDRVPRLLRRAEDPVDPAGRPRDRDRSLLARVFGAGRRSHPTASPTTRLRDGACAPTRPSRTVRVLFDVGAGQRRRCPAFSTTAPSFPLPGTTADHVVPRQRRRAHRPRPPSTGGRRSLPRTTRRRSRAPMTSDPATTSTPDLRLEAGPRRARPLGYVTEPLTTDTVLAGTGSVDLWVRSSKPDVDLEVTISEVRPDGKETYVQSGWLRASQRALDAADVHRAAPGARPTTPRRRRTAAGDRRRARAGAALPVRRTRSAPARGSGSWCSRPAATGRRGRSPRCRRPRTVTISRSDGAAVEGGAAGRVGCRRLDAAARVRHAAGSAVPRRTNRSRTRTRDMSDDA